MRTTRRKFVFAFLAVGTIAMCHQQVVADPIRIMALGDSITRGLNTSGDASGGYRSLLYNRLVDELSYEVDFVGSASDNPDAADLPDPDHEGHGGWRIDTIANNIETYIQETYPAIVLIHLGTNDIVGNYDLDNAPERLNSLINSIATVSPDTHIIVAQIIGSTYAPADALIDTYNAAIPTVVANQQAAGHNVTMVNMNSVVSTDQFDDIYHPTPEGYDAIANTWFSAIEALGTVSNPTLPAGLSPAGNDLLKNTSFDQIYTDAGLMTPVETVTGAYYFSSGGDSKVLSNNISSTDGFYMNGWYVEQSNADRYTAMIATHDETKYFNAGETDGVYLAIRIMESRRSSRTVRQYLDEKFSAGTNYTLSVEVGHRMDISFPTLDGVVVQLLAGDTVLAASDSVTPLPGAGNFETWTFTFDADDLLADYNGFWGQYLSIRLGTQLVGSTAYTWVFFDNVTFESTAAPEPATVAMLGLGGGMMLVRRRRQR